MKLKLPIAFLIILVIIYFLPIPVSQTRSIIIEGSYEKVQYLLNDLHHWRIWWPDPAAIKSIDNTLLVTIQDRYVLQRKEALGLQLSNNKQGILHTISVHPLNEATTAVSWQVNSSFRNLAGEKLGAFFGTRTSIQSCLNSLKSHVEDPDKYYGYNIRVVPVEDTLIVVNRMACSKPAISSCLRALSGALQRALTTAGYTGKAEKMFYVDSSRNDTTFVMAGLSIEKRVLVRPPIEMMKMPKAHIVVGEYEGDYVHVGRIHQAMLRYMKDHNISQVAVPYEKFMVEPRNAMDSQHVKLKVYYPPYIP
ncbi:hypothetical protein EXU57_04435 [Segetibacter sp. 3557_3]|uniref:hypothetical protein n=1 Tax=Segetibacter sp. 3557_3 TaxID=2547429 RepID=UPI001058B128|nr:hypothetical protein [Segetibacter sp. 3557_3]TDH29317.1 hypothetical protein EXU57_04435 [Segetibacter sp. 3557_3]